ncbi:hypothetical protein PENTCL1PPCAC_296, partial [Pristionchus entomophagus]
SLRLPHLEHRSGAGDDQGSGEERVRVPLRGRAGRVSEEGEEPPTLIRANPEGWKERPWTGFDDNIVRRRNSSTTWKEKEPKIQLIHQRRIRAI